LRTQAFRLRMEAERVLRSRGAVGPYPDRDSEGPFTCPNSRSGSSRLRRIRLPLCQGSRHGHHGSFSPESDRAVRHSWRLPGCSCFSEEWWSGPDGFLTEKRTANGGACRSRSRQNRFGLDVWGRPDYVILAYQQLGLSRHRDGRPAPIQRGAVADSGAMVARDAAQAIARNPALAARAGPIYYEDATQGPARSCSLQPDHDC